MNKQAIEQVISSYALENAELRIKLITLQIEIAEIKEEKEVK